MLRPQGMTAPLTLAGRGRDLLTDDAGIASVIGTATVSATVDFQADRLLTDITTEPRVAELNGLLGARVASGFRARLDEVAPELGSSGAVLYQILDDLPGATLVSGHAYITAVGSGRPASMSRAWATVDLCAGWASDATIMLEIDSTGTVPGVLGPVAPALPDPDDPLSWHDLGPLHVHAMRRARRIDVRRHSPGILTVDGVFRDSYVAADGVETVIHEYTVDLTVDVATWKAIDAAATPQTLPWVECPRAALSAGRLAGLELTPLRSTVRRDFTGTSTCTHLNDQLRSLADVPALARQLAD